MTLAELKAQFIVLADDPSITDSQAGIWINNYYKLLLKEYDWSFVVGNGDYTVTSGTQETLFTAFSVAVTDFAKPLRVWLEGSADKVLLSPVNYEDRFAVGLTNAYYITPDNLSIGIVPEPGNSTDTITVDYIKSYADMADGDSPAFISDFHWILIFKALVMYQKQQREVSDEFEIPYQELLAQMLGFYKMPQAVTNPLLTRGSQKVRLPYNSPFRTY